MQPIPMRDIPLLLGVSIVWGFNFAIIKIGLANFPPLLFSCLRFTIVASAIIFVPRPRTKLINIAAIGLVLGVLKFTLLFFGMNYGLNAGLSGIVLQAQVFFTVALSYLVFGDIPKIQQMLGMIFGIGGLTVTFWGVTGHSTAMGFGLVLAAASAWAVANILIRQARSAEPFALIVWASAFAVPPLTVATVVFEGPDRIVGALEGISPSGVASLGYVSLLATLCAYAIWGHMLSIYSASAVAPFALLVPVFGIAGGSLMLGEVPSPATLVGATLIVGGVLIGTVRLRGRTSPNTSTVS